LVMFVTTSKELLVITMYKQKHTMYIPKNKNKNNTM
jgi:hypothetical protein